MGLLDKAKGLVEGHKDQIQHGLDKAKQTINKAGESVNQSATKRLPNTGTMTPVGQTAPPSEEMLSDDVEADQTAPNEGEVPAETAPQAAEPLVAPPPPPGPPMAQSGPDTNP